jgi:uncharacterized protein YprB with RNaseH-like and TPR domain
VRDLMARSGLSGRLSRIREAERRKGDRQPISDIDSAKATSSAEGARKSFPQPSDSAVSSRLPGWTEIGRDLFERESVHAIEGYRDILSPHFPILFPRERESLSSLAGKSKRARSLPRRMTFFDLETTGLSHGAGTVAFMAGLARFEDAGTVTVKQLLMADYPGEEAFLARFEELVGPGDALVSFNGKCFDSQILKTRYLMNGMKPRFLSIETLHLDLLFPSRRLWKRDIGSCRMTDIETAILGIARHDDLPGSEAPEAWFSFLRDGQAERLLAVGDHNREDTVSLARILFALDDAIDRGTGRAALVRALDHRSRGEYAESARFLDPLAEARDPVATRLLAIDSERRLGDLERALELARALNDETRVARVSRKLEAMK